MGAGGVFCVCHDTLASLCNRHVCLQAMLMLGMKGLGGGRNSSQVTGAGAEGQGWTLGLLADLLQGTSWLPGVH